MRLAFRIDLSKDIGIGHYKRAILLSQLLEKSGIQSDIIFGVFEYSHGILSELSKVNYQVIDNINEFDFWFNNKSLYQAIIFDISHSRSRANLNSLSQYLSLIGTLGIPTAFFDGCGDEMISSRISLAVSKIIIPYVCDLTNCLHNDVASGANYFIMPDCSKTVCGEGLRKETAEKILFTFGGSDPTEISSLALESIKILLSGNDLPECKFSMVVGPAHNQAMRQKLFEFSHPRYFVINSPASLHDSICASDIVVTATGLTKYETTYLRKPAIHISSSEALASINKEYAKLEVARDLGLQTDISADFLANELRELIKNYEVRSEMINNAQGIFDGLGSIRIENLIKGLAKGLL